MEKEIYIIKDKIAKEIDVNKSNIILSKKFGKRNEYVWNVGKTNFGETELIFGNEEYCIFAENITYEEKKIILNIVKEPCV
ncbi:hypothetical protein [Haliovirga abyssi]|uniref:Uncharacterized protein n=1 Tax=Haliovirga abyssi TaxID=2996794 RepID=A0AAU9DKS3_9FUSO|nr:hypothetical protein [Haliovirga abyssi]BDU50517.1 hypothetical protein HLVA_10860 [Haliovirga abyssi]